MVQTAIRISARVLPGKRIEATAPEFDEGEEVELIVLRAEPALTRPPGYVSALDFLGSLPPSSLTADDWERIEKEMQEGKAAWER